MRPAALLAILLCGGTKDSLPYPGLSVAGSYDTKVSLLPEGNTCGIPAVRDNPTTIDHARGSGTLTVTHAGAPYPGTVDGAGRFSTPVRRVAGNYDISISGWFNKTGFDAVVQVGQVSPSCAYKVHWVGTKKGPPNTFP